MKGETREEARKGPGRPAWAGLLGDIFAMRQSDLLAPPRRAGDGGKIRLDLSCDPRAGAASRHQRDQSRALKASRKPIKLRGLARVPAHPAHPLRQRPV